MSKRGKKDWKFGGRDQRAENSSRKTGKQILSKDVLAEIFAAIIFSDMDDLAEMVVMFKNNPPAELDAEAAEENLKLYATLEKYIKERILQVPADEEAAEAQEDLRYLARVIAAYLLMNQSPVFGFFQAGNAEAVMGVLFKCFAVRTGLIDPENPSSNPFDKQN